MADEHRDDLRSKKKLSPTDRPFTTALFMLRCAQLGLAVSDLDLLTLGMVNDMITEKANDACEDEYSRTATQADFDAF